ncbi:MAG: dependent oxidoreductase [Proteobacteria bacterium]|nr:dependent oxidoreductase [Pseudomonadota bacterium]
MKIAIIGSGISGLVAAHHLHEAHDLSVFEANDYVGGHTHTHSIELGGMTWSVDSGFIVFNDWTYPNFIALLDELGVQSQPSSMSFSVKCERTGLEYNGTSLNSLFAQRRNLLRPSFLRMVRDILRFNQEAPKLLETGDDRLTLAQYLADHAYSKAFRDHYIVPMGAAIWSANPAGMLDFPAKYFVRFFHNHGMLSVNRRPVWRVVRGGSHSYVEPLTRGFGDRIRLGTSIDRVTRSPSGVFVKPRGTEAEQFDAVVFACHSDQALAMLADASAEEREILAAIPYQENEAILHTDISVLPRKRLAWAAWNYHIRHDTRDRVAVTYNMNILQSLAAAETFCVSLNYGEAIAPNRIIRRTVYHHPVYTPAGVAAQQRHGEISGKNRTYYCGAYWGFGFHEDGVNSALRVVEQIARSENHAELPLRRAG